MLSSLQLIKLSDNILNIYLQWLVFLLKKVTLNSCVILLKIILNVYTYSRTNKLIKL